MKTYTERGARRVFAGALEWPGWCRGARDEDGALEALTAYGPRYAAVVRDTGFAFSAPATAAGLDVVEWVKGDATTDYGAPSIAPAADTEPLSARQLTRLRELLEACWTALDRAADAAEGIELSKGPRGGGRDLPAILAHVAGAEASYLSKLAAPRPKLGETDPRAALAAAHAATLEALHVAVTEGVPATGPRGGALWTARYFLRRDAWHVLDHAWELEDRVKA